MANCGDGDPIVWLGNNWTKLIETVQTLATKYGQEHKQNTTGTISAKEARDALVKHKGNVWQSVTECIEQREKAFKTIFDQGVFSREDIVTHLTHHQGNVEAALNELNHLQLRPFLLKVFGSQVGGVNGPVIDAQSQIEQTKSDQTHIRDSIQQSDEERANILKDIEKIINNLEAKQSKQTETVLQTIETYFETIAARRSGSTSRASRTSRSRTTSLEHINKSSVSPSVPIEEKNIENVQINNAENEAQDNHEAVVDNNLPAEATRLDDNIDEESRNHEHTNDNSTIASSFDYGGSIIELILEEPSDRERSVDYDQDQATDVTTSASPTLTQSNESPENDSSLSPTPLSTRTPSRHSMKYRGPKFLIGRGFSKVSTARLNDKRKIRELEKELKRQMKMPSRRSQDQDSRPESQMTGFISDSTLVADEDRSLITPIPPDTPPRNHVKTYSMKITYEPSVEALDVDQSRRSMDYEQPSTSKDAKNRNLSKMVQDTKQLIQQMKNEIDEDIAMSEREDDNDDTDYFERNGDYYEHGDYDEDLSEETINEDDFDSSDGWIDIDDDEDDDDHNEENIYENLRLNNDSRRSSMESDHFVEAHEELTPSMMQNDSIGLDDGDNNSLEHFDLNDEINEALETSEVIESAQEDSVAAASTISNHNLSTIANNNDSIEIESTENVTSIDLLNNALPADSQEFLESVLRIQNSLHSSIVALNVIELPAESVERELPETTIDSVEADQSTPAEIVIASAPIQPSNESLQVTNQNSEPVTSNQNEIVDSENILPTPTIIVDEIVEAIPDDALEGNVTIENNLTSEVESIVNGTAATSEQIYVEPQNTALSSDENTENNTNNIEEVEVQPEIAQGNFESSQINQEDQMSVITEASSSDAGASDATSDTVIQVTESLANGIHENETDEEVSEIVEENSVSQDEPISDSEIVQNEVIVIDDPAELPAVLTIETQSSENSGLACAAGETSANSDESAEIQTNPETNGEVTQAISHETLVESFKYQKYTIPVITECNQTSINLMQPKKVENVAPKANKIPVRRFSLTGAASSVRQLKNELFNKQISQPKPKPVARKPSKIVPPKLFFKEGVATSTTSEPTPSTSKQTTSSFRELPKKKYYETCFSDDYQTSDDEKPTENTRVIPKLVNISEDSMENKEPEEIIKLLFDEGTVTNENDAIMVVELLRMKFDLKDARSVIGQCSTVEQAIAFLQQECELCTETYPINKIVSMLKCTHSCCVECAKNYFTIQVSDLKGKLPQINLFRNRF